MAKIAFISASNTGWVNIIAPDGYVQGFTNALERMGNEVHSYLVNFYSQSVLDADIVKLKPDFIFTINNVGISENVLNKVDCPVIMVVSDSLPFLNALDLVKKYQERYYFLHTSEDSFNQIDSVFPGTAKNHNLTLGHVTDLRKKNIEQDIPVSFIGSLGNWDRSIVNYFQILSEKNNLGKINIDLNELKDRFLQQMKEYAESPLDVDSSCLSEPALPNFEDLVTRKYACAVVMARTSNLRFGVLSNLTDLGLKVFSYPQGMADVISYNLDLFKCYDFTNSLTLADSELNFNRSKISLNLPHAHVVKGFSWRVPDILASNACLVSDYRPDLKRLMAGYIDLPTYESPAEARELVHKLLKDDVWRKDIVTASQLMIEDKCRFEHRLRKVAERSGLKLEYPQEKGSQSLCGTERKCQDLIVSCSSVNMDSDFVEGIFRFIFRLLITCVPSAGLRKSLRKRFRLNKAVF